MTQTSSACSPRTSDPQQLWSRLRYGQNRPRNLCLGFWNFSPHTIWSKKLKMTDLPLLTLLGISPFPEFEQAYIMLQRIVRSHVWLSLISWPCKNTSQLPILWTVRSSLVKEQSRIYSNEPWVSLQGWQRSTNTWVSTGLAGLFQNWTLFGCLWVGRRSSICRHRWWSRAPMRYAVIEVSRTQG